MDPRPKAPTRSLRAPRGALPPGAVSRGGAVLAAEVAGNLDALEALTQKYSVDGPMIDRALAMVREFIAERGRIVYGGLAIDFALRRQGHRLYPDGRRPDYDFMSPDSVGDAYDLASRLASAGFPEANAIRGIHVQTMRVRVSFVGVADIGYAPPAVYERVPTLDWEGVRFVHPDYQRMDQHLAFCFPLNGAPREDVYHRWRKDLARWNLLNAGYPLAPSGRAPPPARRARGHSALPLSGRAADLGAALHGFAAYSVLRSALDELAAAVSVPPDTSAPKLELVWEDGHSFAVELPAGETATLASPFPVEAARAVDGSGPPQWRAPWMDAQPRTVRVGSTVIFSTANRLLSVAAVRAGPGGQCLVVSPQYLLLWLLCSSFQASEPESSVYRDYYLHTLDVLRSAEAIYAALAQKGPKQAAAARASYLGSPFVPSVRTLGRINQDAAYQVTMSLNAAALGEPLPASLNIPPELSAPVAEIPRNYHPPKPRPAYNYSSSLFLRDGSPMPAPRPHDGALAEGGSRDTPLGWAAIPDTFAGQPGVMAPYGDGDGV